MGGGDVVEIGTDASPWGLGGWLSVDGKIIRLFADAVTSEDVSVFNMARGSADGQQIWEALGMSVAPKLWTKEFALKRISLQVRGDNVGALVLLI